MSVSEKELYSDLLHRAVGPKSETWRIVRRPGKRPTVPGYSRGSRSGDTRVISQDTRGPRQEEQPPPIPTESNIPPSGPGWERSPRRPGNSGIYGGEASGPSPGISSATEHRKSCGFNLDSESSPDRYLFISRHGRILIENIGGRIQLFVQDRAGAVSKMCLSESPLPEC